MPDSTPFWYTWPMNDLESGLVPPVVEVWPPRPRGWEGAEGSVRVEQVEVEQGRDRLTLRNGWARRYLMFGSFAVPFVAAAAPVVGYPGQPDPHTFGPTLPLNTGTTTTNSAMGCRYRRGSLACLRPVATGLFVLDKRGGAVRAGGGLFCLLSELDCVLMRRAAGKWRVYLMRVGGAGSPKWGGFGSPAYPGTPVS